MSLDITSNAAQVAATMDPVLVDDAARRADVEAADTALALITPQTPRRTGRLAAGGRVAVASAGWAYVNAVAYATVVNARTGFATKTLQDQETKITAIYDRELQTEFDTL